MRWKALRAEMAPLLSLAMPLIFGELGWIAMSVVDTAMLGRAADSSLALAASSLAQVLFNTLAFGVGGILLAMDTLISQALGEGNRRSANQWFLHGLLTAVVLAVLLFATVAVVPNLLIHLPIDRNVMLAAIPAMRGLNYGVLPLFVYFALRRYLQAAHRGKVIMAALLSANVVNVMADWLLIYGHRWHLGSQLVEIPAYGVAGSSWATSAARLYLMLFLALALSLANKRHGYDLGATERRIEFTRLRHILRLGAPVGAQIFVEVALFALATSVIATFGAVPLAGHEIALQCASTTFMVPLAISGATSVRVGHAIGRVRAGIAERQEIAAAGWSGILVGAGFMVCSATLFVFLRVRVAALFTTDPLVIQTTAQLLLIAAAFQFFDGIQCTATGALRGAGRTLAPLLVQLVCFWAIATPLGLLFALHLHGGARCMWWGLALGLTPAAFGLVYAWQRTVKDPALLQRTHEHTASAA